MPKPPPSLARSRSPAPALALAALRLALFAAFAIPVFAALAFLLALALPASRPAPLAAWFRACARSAVSIGTSAFAIATFLLAGHVEICVTSALPSRDLARRRAILFCNHQTFLDWWFLGLWAWHTGNIDGIKIALLDYLKHVPFAGWTLYFAGFIFLKQNWAHDEQVIRANLGQVPFRPDEPLLLIVFPEGLLVQTRHVESSKRFLDKQRHDIEARTLPQGTYIPANPPVHVILPRSRGLKCCLSQLHPITPPSLDSAVAPKSDDARYSPVTTLVDVTMGFWPSSRGWETGIYPHHSVNPITVFGFGGPAVLSRVCIDLKPAVAEDTAGIAELVALDEVQFDGWLKRRWEEKDSLMAGFHDTGSFPASTTKPKTASACFEAYSFRVVPKLRDWISVSAMYVVFWCLIVFLPVAGTDLALPVVRWSGGGDGDDGKLVVIVVHGVKRRVFEAGSLIPPMHGGGALSPRWEMYAPIFHAAGGADDDGAAPDYGGVAVDARAHLVWRGAAGYAAGHAAANAAGTSSFDAMDALVMHALAGGGEAAAAALRVVGFSAGAQFATRYAAVSRVLEACSSSSRDVRVVAGSASSWLYLDARRLRIDHAAHGADGATAEIAADAFCEQGRASNAWKYGLDAIPRALLSAGDTVETIRARVLRSNLTIVLVRDDNAVSGGSLDTSPPALAQCRSHRFARARVYVAYLKTVWDMPNLDVVVVDNCGHSAAKVYACESVRKAVFG
ncbi:hypothetical protein HDU84_001017 [Entophlyctis sp. JEL0112]|nr:hypothetical protein HDU84_001017 [Entophlyctis sp. JEL0112]